MGWSLKKVFPGGHSNPLQGISSGFKDFGRWFDGRKAIEYQNQLNRENWEMENAYNTPAAQMARYKEAGLNPNLIYGQSNTAGSISSAGVPESGSSVVGRIGSLISTWYGIKDMKANIANKQAQNTLLNSQADYVNEQVRGQALENALRRKTLDSIGPGGNPNDPWYYRELKKHNPMNPVLGVVGTGVGSATRANPEWTVRINGKEYTATSEAEVEWLLNHKSNRLSPRKDKGR